MDAVDVMVDPEVEVCQELEVNQADLEVSENPVLA